MDNQLYYGAIFLDEISKKRLVKWWQQTTNFPLYSNVLADRLILFYDIEQEELQELPLECIIIMKIRGCCFDHHCQTVVVRSEIPTADKVSNITVAVNSPDPIYSNVALARKFSPIDGPMLTGEFNVGILPPKTQILVPKLELVK